MSHPSCLIWDVRGAVCSTPSIGCSPSVLLSGAFAGAAPGGASLAASLAAPSGAPSGAPGGASGGASGSAPGFLMIWEQN